MTRPMTDSEVCDLIEAVRWELEAAKERIAELERIVSINGETLDRLRNRVYALEHDTPQARRLQYEADLAAADLAASGGDYPDPIGAERHGPGCLCPYCPDETDE